MPVIAPPPDSFTGPPEDYYQQLEAALTLTASGANDEFLTIALTSAPNSTVPPDPALFAMTGGFVRHYPPGTIIPSPDSFSDPSAGTLVLTTWLGDIEAQARAFPPGTPPISRIYYIGVDSAATAILLRVQTATMSEAALRASWKSEQGSAAPANAPVGDLVDAHNQRVMGGTGSVFVEGGTPIGQMTKELTAAVDTYRTILRITDNGTPPAYAALPPTLIGAPYYEL